MSRELQVTTSPRSTWLWAATDEDASEVRSLLDTHGQYWSPARRYGQEVPLVTDVEIGNTAWEAVGLVAAAGWSFRWHPDQHPLNRRETLLRFSIAQARE